MKTLWQDIRFSVRMMLKLPSFTFIAVMTLALGIGANTAIFSLVNAVLLKPLQFNEPERLVMVWEDASFLGAPNDTPAPGNYADWKAQNKVFEDMAALSFQSFNLTGGSGEPERVNAYATTANFFPMLGVKPEIGRVFTSEEDKPEAGKVAVISFNLWQSRYGGERGILEKNISLNGESYKVIGVMPAEFQFLVSNVNIWTPAQFTPKTLADKDSHYLNVVARLRKDVTVEQAQAEMKTIMARIVKDSGESDKLSVAVVPLSEQLSGNVRRPFILLLVAVAFVLLIACANIANLQLSRAASRTKEIAIRTALGAGRTRIVRQLLTESLLLSIVGGLLGLLLAVWSFTFLQQLIPQNIALSAKLNLDVRVLGFSLLISLFTGVIFGLVPALQIAGTDVQSSLKQEGRGGSGIGKSKLRSGLIIAEVALSLILLIGAGLLIQTVYKLRYQDLGFRSENVLTIRTNLTTKKYEDHTKRVAFYDDVLERVRHLPGVVSAGYTNTVPLVWIGGGSGLSIEGRPANPDEVVNALQRYISADYLQTMGMQLRYGRFFNESDSAQTEPVVIINETFARAFWANESPLGKRIKVGQPDNDKRPWLTIVGVTKDIKGRGLDAEVKPEMYAPYRQVNYNAWAAPKDLAIRTSVEPMSIVGSVRQVIKDVDPDQPVSNIRTMDEILGAQVLQQRLGMTLMVFFAALALLLAAIGIYGVLSYFVTGHTQEIGVRMALGAKTGDILAIVLKKGMGLAFAGLAIGLASSFALTRYIRSLLYGISANDWKTFIIVSLVLTGVALIACLIPARRATKVNPIVALKHE